MIKPQINSKLPHIGTTIFTVMSKLANDCGALNLSQGFPSFDCSPNLVDLVTKYMKKGLNQYAPMAGVQPLREMLAHKTEKLYGVKFDANTEITITSGATEVIFAAVAATINIGDEVIVFEPAYDSYVPAIELAGGKPVYITLTPQNNYQIDWQEVKNKISDKTKMIMLTTPHNPVGTVLSKEDLDALAQLVQGTDILILSDEVYEHIIFDDNQHLSLITHPMLKDRTFVCNSFGKTFHVTGWKIGYCIASEALTSEFRKVHQFLTFSSNTPIQFALAEYLEDESRYLTLPAFYEAKRDKFLQSIAHSRLKFVPSAGSFFQSVDYSAITDEHDYDLAIRLTHEIGVASIPLSVFYHKKNDYKILRFCFAKDDEMIEMAGERLSKL